MTTKTRPANTKYGYRFGCDGVVDINKAMEMLGVKSKTTVNKYAEEKRFRSGKHEGADCSKGVYCRRSILDYLDSLET